jgi:16S rRNA (cytidine1402-2'-O)-methyltransferase
MPPPSPANSSPAKPPPAKQPAASPVFHIAASAFEAPRPAPGLYLVATPIGNLADVTLRALATLAGVDYVLCEDTRVTAKLFDRYRISTTLKPYHDHNAAKVRPGILDDLSKGAAIALVSDAGTPLISDPGWKLVRDARSAGINVTVVPGASAALAAMTMSGLPTDRFMFCGFLPPKSAARRAALQRLVAIPATLVFYESAPRIAATLADVAAVLGERSTVIAREITKLHEEVLSGTPGELAAAIAARGRLKGELTLLVAPPDDGARLDDPAEIDAALRAELAGTPASQAAAAVARRYGLPRQEVYRRAIVLQHGDKPDPDRR